LATQEALAAAGTIVAAVEPDRVLAALCTEVERLLGAEAVSVRMGSAGLGGRALATGAPALGTSALAVPLEPGRALEVAFPSGRRVDAADAELAAGLAAVAGLAARTAAALAAARGEAARDSLTGCLNHAGLQERLREEISRAERGGHPFALAILDLDDFKAVNERFGHLAGDAVLRTVGELLRGSVRLHDQVARLGGDEFALVLTATGEPQARTVVDRAVRSLREAPMPSGRTLRASAGIAPWRLGDQATSLIEQADEALRSAKRARRPAAVARSAMAASAPGEERLRRLATAGTLGAKLTRLLDAEAIATLAGAELREALGCEACAVLPLEACPREGATGRCLRERRSVLLGERLAVPVYAGGTLWGAVDARSAPAGGFDADDATLVQTVADHVGAALHTAERYRELEERAAALVRVLSQR
jgi:diguanylate cyclase (GGDEF)-like protein